MRLSPVYKTYKEALQWTKDEALKTGVWSGTNKINSTDLVFRFANSSFTHHYYSDNYPINIIEISGANIEWRNCNQWTLGNPAARISKLGVNIYAPDELSPFTLKPDIMYAAFNNCIQPDSSYYRVTTLPVLTVRQATVSNITEQYPLPPDPLKNVGRCEGFSTPLAGNPVHIGTGNKFQQENDYIGLGPFAVDFRRFYNSTATGTTTGLGQYWRNSYDRTITASDAITTKVHREDGKTFEFLYDGVAWKPDPDVTTRLEEILDGQGTRIGWRYVASDDSVEDYNIAGKLLSLTNRAGFAQTLDYDVPVAEGGDADPDTLDKVAGPFGRTLAFTYDGSARISEMVDPAGETYTYNYDVNGNLASVSYPDETPNDPSDNPKRLYHYEDVNFPNGLTGITDETGNRFASWGYDSQGRAIFSEHASGAERVDIVYNADDTTTVTDSLGNVRTYNFEVQYGVIKTSQIDGGPCASCAGQSHSFTYDSNGFIASKTDFNGNQTTVINDSRGLQTSSTEAVGTPEERTITTEWHPTFRLPTKVTEPGRETTYSYDTQGRLLTVEAKTLPNLEVIRTTTNIFGLYGLLSTIDGPRTDVSDIVTFEYDGFGNLIKTTNALGHETNITEYDAHGQPLTVQDANNITTNLTYDARGRIITRSIDGQITTFDYDGVGNITKVTLPNGSFLSNEYDEAQRLIAVGDNLGNRIEYTLDSFGNRTKEEIKDPQGTLTRTLSHTYNSLNRLIESIGGANQNTTYTYDDNGNRTSMTTDPTGLSQETQQAFDALNRLTSSTDANQGITDFTYDARDNLTSLTDPRGLTTTFNYDELDNLVLKDSPDTGLTTFSYDSAWNPINQTDARGITTSFTYDALNRLTSIDYPDNSQDVTLTYDSCTNGIGQLCVMTDGSGTTTLSYDATGNRNTQTSSIDGITQTVSYAYNEADQLIQITYPSGRTVDYVRNALGQIDGVTTTKDAITEILASNIAYEPLGPMNGLTYGNGLTHAQGFDLDYRLTALTTGSVEDLSYTFDDTNNITTLLNINDAARDQIFNYDEINHLTNATGLYGDLDYTYDANGNRLTDDINSSNPKTYTYDTNSHRLIQTNNGSTDNYGYDANGNTTQDGNFSYVYGDHNRLITVTTLSGTTIAEYTYNGRSERVKKVGTETTLYYYDQSGLLLAEIDSTGNTQV